MTFETNGTVIFFPCVNNAVVSCRSVGGLYSVLKMHCGLDHGGLFLWKCSKAKVKFTILFAFFTYF